MKDAKAAKEVSNAPVLTMVKRWIGKAVWWIKSSVGYALKSESDED